MCVCVGGEPTQDTSEELCEGIGPINGCGSTTASIPNHVGSLFGEVVGRFYLYGTGTGVGEVDIVDSSGTGDGEIGRDDLSWTGAGEVDKVDLFGEVVGRFYLSGTGTGV